MRDEEVIGTISGILIMPQVNAILLHKTACLPSFSADGSHLRCCVVEAVGYVCRGASTLPPLLAPVEGGILEREGGAPTQGYTGGALAHGAAWRALGHGRAVGGAVHGRRFAAVGGWAWDEGRYLISEGG